MERDLDRDINYSRAVGLRLPEALIASPLPSALERNIYSIEKVNTVKKNKSTNFETKLNSTKDCNVY